MKNNGEISPPFLRDLRSSDFVRSRKIVKISESELAHNGLLTPTQNGFIIHLRSNLERKKKRTVVAHELGHTFFYNMSLEPPVQFISDQHSVLDNWAVEGAAFEIGRQILIPSDWLDSVKRRESLEIFFSLIEKFDVTRDILARRLFHYLDSLGRSAIFFTHSGQRSFTAKKAAVQKQQIQGVPNKRSLCGHLRLDYSECGQQGRDSSRFDNSEADSVSHRSLSVWKSPDVLMSFEKRQLKESLNSASDKYDWR